MNRLIEYVALRPDVARALRVSVGLAVPLFVCHALHRPGEAVFVALAMQSIALPDLRGAYGMRLMILGLMIFVAAASAFLGVCASGHIVWAVLITGGFALLGGWWRHVSADYGPPLSVSSALLFLLGLSQQGAWREGLHLAGLILLGGAGATLLHMLIWPFRPQHPLRYAVAESWVAASDLVARMRPQAGGAGQAEAIREQERELRATLDRTFVILGAASRGQPVLVARLEELRRQVVHFVMRLLAFHTALESLPAGQGLARHLPAVDSVLKALSDAARSVAITLITHRAQNFAATEVRLQRGLHLLRVLDGQLAGAGASAGLGVAQARAALEQIAQAIPPIRTALGATTDHSDSAAGFGARLPELGTRSIHSLSAWMNTAPQLDTVLVRYALRMAVLTMVAVALYMSFHIPHGYWIAFTIVVVLQPDYGSTRKRAAERIGGTLAGSLAGSALLWIKMPLFLLDGCAAAMAFGFAYFLKRRYDVAVFFVTLMLVLLTETTTTLHLDFTITRILSNLAAGVVALLSAVVFWPVWEGATFTAQLAGAIRANRAYLEAIAAWLSPTEPPPEDLLMTKRRAENANRFAAASLQRMLAEPGGRADRKVRATALTTYDERLTRAVTAIAAQLHGAERLADPAASSAARQVADTLETLARTIEEEPSAASQAAAAQPFATQVTALETLLAEAPVPARTPDGALTPGHLIWINLAKCVVEIRAISLALG